MRHVCGAKCRFLRGVPGGDASLVVSLSWLLLRTFCGKNGKGRERSRKVMYGYVVTL